MVLRSLMGVFLAIAAEQGSLHYMLASRSCARRRSLGLAGSRRLSLEIFLSHDGCHPPLAMPFKSGIEGVIVKVLIFR